MLYRKHTNQPEFNMSLFEDINRPTLSVVADTDPRHLMASLFLNAVSDDETVVDGDGEEVVIPAHAFSD
tara:strand:- start:136 stop:342 length:207 start_codon:yes stop_codon:yes gene_type:complete